MNELGRYIIMMGIMLIFVGGIVYILGDKTSWFGNLFGDMKYEGEKVRVYAPFASMIVVSIVLTIVINVITRFFR